MPPRRELPRREDLLVDPPQAGPDEVGSAPPEPEPAGEAEAEAGQADAHVQADEQPGQADAHVQPDEQPGQADAAGDDSSAHAPGGPFGEEFDPGKFGRDKGQ